MNNLILIIYDEQNPSEKYFPKYCPRYYCLIYLILLYSMEIILLSRTFIMIYIKFICSL